MLVCPDVPFDAPQTLAFRVPGPELVSLRDALRHAHEQAEGAPLRAQWTRHIDTYRATRQRTRWRVPGDTLRELLTQLRRASDRIRAEPSPGGPEPADLATLQTQCDRWKHIIGNAPHIDLAPDRWLAFAMQVRDQLRPYLMADGRPPLGYEWGTWAERLAQLDDPPESLDPDTTTSIPASPPRRAPSRTFATCGTSSSVAGPEPSRERLGVSVHYERSYPRRRSSRRIL